MVMVTFNFLVFMLLWSFFQSMLTDPGQVPVFWVIYDLKYQSYDQGFHQGDSDQKRKRYCLMCNVFKPERCHHCSSCGRCVLNMDHHCPWINNCIGFWNRKHFILMLVYVLLTSYFTAIAISIPLYQNIQQVIYLVNVQSFQNYTRFSEGDWKYEEAWDICALFIIVFIDIAVAFLITVFLKFHFMLLSQNKTTIENLEAKGKFFVSRFDKGLFDNFYQVFGTNMYLWPFPAYFESGKPLGDGVNWVIKQQEEKVEYVEDNESKTIKKRGVKSDDGDETDVNSHQNHNSNQPNMNNDKSKGYGKIVINPQLTNKSQLKSVINQSQQKRDKILDGSQILPKK
eukprot:403347394